MARFEVVEARRHMCGRMARQLRLEHAASTARIGIDVHRGLRDIYDQSFYRRAWLIDGNLAAIGGATGSLMSPATFVWLALTESAKRYPMAIVKEAKRQMAIIKSMGKQELVTTIIDGDESAARLLIFLGWHSTDTGEGAAAETRWGRRRLANFIARESDIRIPVGGGHAIRMGWHEPYDAYRMEA